MSIWQIINPLQCAYAVVGPGLACLFAYGAYSARMRFVKIYADLEKLRKEGREGEVVQPPVVVMVPAKDEGIKIRPCLETIVAQDYAGPMRILAIDDRSSDLTAAIMDEFAARDPRVSVLRIVPGSLPAGWMGKSNALWQGVASMSPADSEWLLFVDSDVTLQPQAVTLAMRQAVSRGFDSLSLLTRQTCNSFWEKLLVPPMGASVLGAYLTSHTNNENRPDTAFANGQFFLIRREAYFKVGGHEAIKWAWAEDVELMRVMKKAGCRVRLYGGEHLAATRMYDDLGAIFGGWSRIFASCSHRRPWRIFLTMAVLTVLMMGPVMAVLAAVMSTGDVRLVWAVLAGLHLAFLFPLMGFVYWVSGNTMWLVGLFPVTWVMSMAMLVQSLLLCRTGRLKWRGTFYAPRTA